MSKVYVVTAPDAIRGIYEAWPACEAAVRGVAGARYQAVSSHNEAIAMLEGGGIVLTPGVYAFVDGNAQGGVGVVLVLRRETGQAVYEVSTTVHEIFTALPEPVPTLEDRPAIDRALDRLRNVLAELAAAYQALRLAPSDDSSLTLVYDYLGIGAWLQGTWRIQDRTVEAIVFAMRTMINIKGLTLTYHHQPAHRSSVAGRHDYAAFNARADVLATAATASLSGPTEAPHAPCR